MKLLLLGSKFFCSIVMVLPFVAIAGQPIAPTPDLPGASKGSLETYWLGPNVRFSAESIGKHGSSIVTWLNDDGSVRRQVEVGGAQPGYLWRTSRLGPEAVVRSPDSPDVLQRYAFRNVFWGVNEDWEFTLPSNRPPGFTTSTPDSRLFVHEFHPTQGQIALDVYLHGELVNTAGPYRQYKGEGVELSDDGSAGLIVWKDETEKTAQLVVVGPDGKISFQVNCEDPVVDPIPAPGGTGALLRCNMGGTNENKFLWYTREGKLCSLYVSPNPHCVGWIPKTQMSLFSVSGGFDSRYRLINWKDATTVWEIPCPGDHGHTLAIGVTPRLIVFAVGEHYHPGAWRGTEWVIRENQSEWIRAFYAVSVENGKVVARWRATYPQRLRTDDRNRFLLLGDRLFFITSDEVVELSEQEIISKLNGWK